MSATSTIINEGRRNIPVGMSNVPIVLKIMCVEFVLALNLVDLQTRLPHLFWHSVLEFGDMFSVPLIIDKDQRMSILNADNNSNFLPSE
jgi:hypothetical protein